jgi:DNA-binding transcriptional MocR family regulator
MTDSVKTISFARGAPSLDLIPVEGLKESAVNAFTNDPAGAFGYGTAVGYVPLRQWIAEKEGVEIDRVIVTNGSLHACALMFDQLVEPGTQVAIEQPLYDRSLLMLKQRGAELKGYSLQDDGFDLDALEADLKNGYKPRFVYTIPHFHNPGGCTMPLGKRQRLVDLAGEYGFLIVEDDPYRDIVFDGESLPSMLSLDAGGERVAFMNSFTKQVCPGLRIGYAIGPKSLIKDMVTAGTNTYISPGQASEAILNDYVRAGKLDDSIQVVRTALGERRTALAEALNEHLPQATFVVPQGGYFMWVDLGEGVNTDEIAVKAAEAGVPITKGSDFMLEGGQNAMRLAYSAVHPDEIREGVKRLAEIVNNG